MKNKCAPIGRCPYANRVEFFDAKQTYLLGSAIECSSSLSVARRLDATAVCLQPATRSRSSPSMAGDKEPQASRRQGVASEHRIAPPACSRQILPRDAVSPPEWSLAAAEH
jgi:hypothetical protein